MNQVSIGKYDDEYALLRHEISLLKEQINLLRGSVDEETGSIDLNGLRLNELENAIDAQRIVNEEQSKTIAQNSRNINTQATRITNLQGKDVVHDGKIQVLELKTVAQDVKIAAMQELIVFNEGTTQVKLAALQQEISTHDAMITHLDGRCDHLNDRLSALEADNLDHRLDVLEASSGGVDGGLIGEIVMYSAPLNTALPINWWHCDGSPFPISSYTQLFNTIGYTYSNGRTPPSGMFYLPDMRNLYVKGAAFLRNETYDFIQRSTAYPVGTFLSQAVQSHVHAYIDRGAGAGDNAQKQQTGTAKLDFAKPNSATFTTGDITYANAEAYEANIKWDQDTRPYTMCLAYIIRIR